ncbi:MAG: hypothetical protein C4336_07450 [Armatimonadota bacterium]
MLGKLLRGLALWIGVYGILTAIHFGMLWGLDQVRNRLETRFEDQYGSEVVDREPPYTTPEWLIVGLDIQPIQWLESLAMSAVMSLPVAVFLGLGAKVFRRGLGFKLIGVSIVTSMLMFSLLYLLNEQLSAGYLVQAKPPVLIVGTLVGWVQGWVASLIYGGARRQGGGEG